MFDNLKWAIVETTSKCNIDCKNCWRVQDKDFKAVNMDMELFKKIIDQIPTGTWTNLFMDGDPFCNERFHDMLTYAQGRGLKVCFSTNGMTFTDVSKSIMESFIESTLPGQLLFSIDGFSPDVTETYRQGTKHDRVEGTINWAIDTKKKSKLKNVDIGVRMCDRGQEWQEVKLFVEHWLDRGADIVMVCKELKLGNNRPYQNMYQCRYMDGTYIVINAHGEMIMCERAAGNKIVIGDCRKESVLDMYNRSLGMDPDYCERCQASYTGEPIRGMMVSDKGKMYHFKEDYFQRLYTTRTNMDAIK